MISRLRTTEDIENKLLDLDKKLRLSSKASIMRLAIACSLRMSGDPRDKGDRRMHYDIRNQNGLDYVSNPKLIRFALFKMPVKIVFTRC